MFILPSFDVTSSSKRWRMREGKGFILSNKVIAIWESNAEDYMGSWRRSCFLDLWLCRNMFSVPAFFLWVPLEYANRELLLMESSLLIDK